MKQITQLFAFVTVDENGDEGIIGFLNGQLWYPMVGSDFARIESLMPRAQEIVNATRQPVRIIRFSNHEQIGEVQPQGEGHQ